MAGLKKLFTVERTQFQANSSESPDPEEYPLPSSGISPIPDLTAHSPDTRPPRLPHKNHQAFQGIEKQFEELHDEIQSGPPRSPASKLYIPIDVKPAPLRTKRHVDVLEAIFSAHRYRVSRPVSPTTLYNEDIAERNLKVRANRSNASLRCRIYQEDVADRNMKANGSMMLSSSHEDLYARTFAKKRGQKTIPRSKSSISNRRGSSDEDSKAALRVIASDQDLRKRQYPSIDGHLFAITTPRKAESNSENPLRLRNSAPALSVQSEDGEQAQSRTEQTTKRPKSALSIPVRSKSIPKTHNSPSTGNTTIRPNSNKLNNPSSETIQSRLLSPSSARLSSKKNVRDLSINTQLAAPRKKFVKVPNKSADIPLPTPRKEPTASIAEIVNSPLAVTTPSIATPGTGGYNADEIMNLFKQAYKSSHISSPHQTFETLQEAIVREINSHDAFRHINSDSSTQESPAPGLCTDVSADDCHTPTNDDHVVSRPSSRSVLAKDGKRRSRSAGRLSSRKPRRSSDALGRELSFPALKGLESRSGHDESGTNIPKRRHTYAQPPSLDLVRSYESQMPPIKHGKSNSKVKKPSESIAKRFSDTPIIKRPDDEFAPGNNNSSHNRPQSSHGLLSKAVSAIWDTSDSSKRSSRRSPRRDHTASAKSGSKAKTLLPPEIHFDGAGSDEDYNIPAVAVRHATGSAPQSPTRSHNITAHTHNTNPNSNPKQINAANPARKMYHTSPIAASRKNVPPQKSALHIDILEAARVKG